MLKIAICGAGNRGTGYSEILLKNRTRGQVTAVADPRDFYRDGLGDKWHIPPEKRFSDWRGLLNAPKDADAVILSMPDHCHSEPAIAFAEAGYHILLEKPMAPTLAECEAITEAVGKAGTIFGVCHVLRYTPYYQILKKIIDRGEIGEVRGIQHLESVVYWHHAHGFVRGNWRNRKESGFILLTKSCHDLDIMNYLVGRPWRAVSSFGGLTGLNHAHRPAGSAERCLDCPQAVESGCPYSALKIYWRDRAEKGDWKWPVDILTGVPTREALFEALRNGPYGRCVYACDNDVADHQTVAIEFDGGVFADFTLTAFTPLGGRRITSIFGTAGMIRGDGVKLDISRYLDDSSRTIDTAAGMSGSIADGHGGGDAGIIHAFLDAVESRDQSKMLSGPEETLESHRIVFKAEESRNKRQTIFFSQGQPQKEDLLWKQREKFSH